jgi:hypothetical protein
MRAGALAGPAGSAVSHVSEKLTAGFLRGSNKFPDPEGLVAKFNAAGMRLAANLKPCLLDDHPMFSGTQYSMQGVEVPAMSRLDFPVSPAPLHAHLCTTGWAAWPMPV